jgi:hypothetical protein
MEKRNIIITTVLSVLFLAAFCALAWQEPSQDPPQGNVPAPLNIGSASQTKEGILSVSAGGGDALTVQSGGDLKIYAPDGEGYALLYVDADGELVTPGDLQVGGVSIKGEGAISSNLNADKLDDYHAADLLAQTGGGSAIYYLKCQWTRSSFRYFGGSYSSSYKTECEAGSTSCTPPSCASGDTSLGTSCVANGVSRVNIGASDDQCITTVGYCERVCRDE